MNVARWEKVSIVAVVALSAAGREMLPSRVQLGEVALLAAVVLLVQGLVRDLVRLRARRAAAETGHRVTCVCTESTLGVGLIVIGTILLFGASSIAFRVPPIAWPIATAAITSFGFATRHLVLDWKTRSLRWEPDHNGVVVWKNG